MYIGLKTMNQNYFASVTHLSFYSLHIIWRLLISNNGSPLYFIHMLNKMF